MYEILERLQDLLLLFLDASQRTRRVEIQGVARGMYVFTLFLYHFLECCADFQEAFRLIACDVHAGDARLGCFGCCGRLGCVRCCLCLCKPRRKECVKII